MTHLRLWERVGWFCHYHSQAAGAVKCALRHGKPSHSQRGRGDDEGAATVTVCDGGNDGDGGGVEDNAVVAAAVRRRYSAAAVATVTAVAATVEAGAEKATAATDWAAVRRR